MIAAGCVSLIMACTQAAWGYQDVGEDFGTAWLEEHGSQPVSVLEAQNSLWDWGNVPKGYKILNGTLYPPGYGPTVYYPTLMAALDPIVLNNTMVANYISPNLQTSTPYYQDPWLLAQLSGRPVVTLNMPESPLF